MTTSNEIRNWKKKADAGDAESAFLIYITHTDPHFCSSTPCVLHIAVSGYYGSSYTLTVSQNPEEPVRLFDGQPLRVSSPPDGWRYFKFSLGASAVPGSHQSSRSG